MQSPADVSRYRDLGWDIRIESTSALMLNTRGVVVSQTTVSIGSLNASLVHLRAVRDAVRHSAASMILVHNHPSGDVTPSQEDIQLTRRS